MSIVPYTGGGGALGTQGRQFGNRSFRDLVRRAVRHYAPSVAQRVRDAAMGYAAEKFSEFRKKGIKRPRTAASSAMGPPRRVRKFKFHTVGGSGKKFSKKGASSKLSVYLKKGFNMKVESGGTKTDAEAVYVGHTSLPINRVVPCVFYALARRILNGQKCYPTDGLQATGLQAITVYWQYRTSFNGIIATSAGTAVGANSSIVALGNALGAEILTLIATTTVYFELTKMQVYETTGGALMYEANVDGIKVQVDAVSNLQVQNRTHATGAGDESNALDVSNNPLRGKMYIGYSNIHPYRFNNDTAVSCPSLDYDNSTGCLATSASDANFTTEMAQTMHKPPPRSAFGNVTSTKYVRIGPGEIRRSKITAKLNLNFNNFIKMYLDTMRGPTQIYNLNQTLVSKGRSVFFGLEKLCDSGGEGSDISIGYEATHSVNALVTIANKNYCNPYVLI